MRYGYSRTDIPFQLERLSDELRARLWNAIYKTLIQFLTSEEELIRIAYHHHDSGASFLCNEIFDAFFKHKTRAICSNGFSKQAFDYIEKSFDKIVWYRVFDFLEFLYEALHQLEESSAWASEQNRAREAREHLEEAINRVLEEEHAGYRFVSGKITPITSEVETLNIEQALESVKAEQFNTVREHLKKALSLFSDREAPDYENSIKEAVSALEALARELTGKDNATLGKVIPGLGKRLKLHPALVEAIKNLYGYASDESGIRHSKKEGRPSPTQADARLILVLASALANYLIDRSRELG